MSENIKIYEIANKIKLDSGLEFGPIKVAYETYGSLNQDKTNAIIVCHALTGDQFVSGINPVTKRDGWWSQVVGSGKLIDTDKYFIICSNVLCGCMGTTGPSEKDENGKIYGINFPVITIGDMVKAQVELVNSFGIEKLFAVIGGSMGGMQVLEWIANYPDRLYCAVPIATAARHSAQNIAFHEVGRQAVMADPDWCEGKYIETNNFPQKGLKVARMAAHITYMSDTALQNKFGRKLQNREKITYGFEADFQIESYLRYQGTSFVDRFDANSYLYITRAMDYFDLAAKFDNSLAKAFEKFKGRACVVSFSSDWHYPPSESRHIVRSMMSAGVHVASLEVETDKGHDAFLLDEPVFHRALAGFIQSASEAYINEGAK